MAHMIPMIVLGRFDRYIPLSHFVSFILPPPFFASLYHKFVNISTLSVVRILRFEEKSKMDLWKFEKSQARKKRRNFLFILLRRIDRGDQHSADGTAMVAFLDLLYHKLVKISRFPRPNHAVRRVFHPQLACGISSMRSIVYHQAADIHAPRDDIRLRR